MNNHGNPLFTLRKPDERALLEIWHIGYGPNITYGLCVADPNLYRSGRPAAFASNIEAIPRISPTPSRPECYVELLGAKK